MTKIILAVISSFVLTVVLMPVLIKLIKRHAYGQTILKYVEEHKSKQGTPTMGGVVFFVATLILVFFFLRYSADWFMCLLVGLGFALLGGMDDFIKVKLKRNLGLRPYQKIVGQIGIALIFAFYIYYSIGTSIVLPFWNKSFNVGFWIIPIIVLTCLATTNAVNLTDGLDGLAGSVSAVVCAIFVAIMMILKHNATNTILLERYYSLAVLMAIFMGSILGFLIFNTNKASIFMGDVGSLGIGGMLSAVFSIVGIELALIFVGVCYVMSALSVIIQVLVYKKTKKRVFKMAPIHHHFQQSGFSEAKISLAYTMATLMMGLVLVISYL